SEHKYTGSVVILWSLMMNFLFNRDRTVQAIACLLKLNGNRMNFMRLLKLLYIADREMLAEHAYIITGDSPVAMRRGPVLENTYALIRGGGPGWDPFLKKEHYHIALIADPGHGKLSQAIERKLKEVFDRYIDKDEFDMVAETHGFPEW